MIATIYILFLAAATFTSWAITEERCPRVIVAISGLVTGILMIPVAIHLAVLF